MMVSTMIWLIVGGLLEPCWVIALRKSESYTNKKWTVLAAFFIVLSPYCLSVAMLDCPMGTAYAIWTGIGAVGTVLAGMVLYKEKISRMQVFFLFVIIVGITGLQIFGGS